MSDYFRTALTYVFVLSIAFVLSFITFFASSRIIGENDKQAELGNLGVRGLIIEQNLLEVENILNQLIEDGGILNLARQEDPFEGSRIVQIIETQQSLFNYGRTNGFVLDYYILLKSGVVMSVDGTTRLDDFLNFNFKPHVSRDEKWAFCFEEYHWLEYLGVVPFVNDGEELKMPVICQTIGPFYDPLGVIFIQLDQAYIDTLVYPDSLRVSASWLLDGKGQVIGGMPGELQPEQFSLLQGRKGAFREDFGNGPGIVNYYRLERFDWMLVSEKLEKDILRNLRRLQLIFLLVFGLTLTAGLFTTRIFSLNISRREDRMRQAIGEQKRLMEAKFFSMLYKGEFHERELLESYMKTIGFAPSFSRYTVLVLSFIPESDDTDSRALLETGARMQVELKENAPRCLFTENERPGRIVALFGLNEDDNPKAAANPEALWKDLSLPQYKAALGKVTDRLFDIPGAYDSAVVLLNRLRYRRDGNLLIYSELDEHESSLVIPDRSYEDRIRQHIYDGEPDMVSRVFDSLFPVSPAVEGLFLAQLNLFTLPFVPEENRSDELRKTALLRGADKERHLKEVLVGAAEQNRLKKREYNASLPERIEGYIRENIRDSSLSLLGTASAFGLTDVYLSRFFKEKRGTNFSVFMQNLRMDLAKTELSDTDHPVKRIAQDVGYLSLGTFVKAFKRQFGITPSQYREQRKRDKRV